MNTRPCTLRLRSLVLGESLPKICLPLTASTAPALLEEARACLAMNPDLLEWRADHFDHVRNGIAIIATLVELRKVIGEVPLIFTLRTTREGGAFPEGTALYGDLLLKAAAGGHVDVIDVELEQASRFPDDLERLRRFLDGGFTDPVPVLMASHHNFQVTPPEEEIRARFQAMADHPARFALGKIAVMPRSPADVLTLMNAARTQADSPSPIPLIAISMGAAGLVSRVAAGVCGSVLTFGAGVRTSAPGQIPADRLRDALSLLNPET